MRSMNRHVGARIRLLLPITIALASLSLASCGEEARSEARPAIGEIVSEPAHFDRVKVDGVASPLGSAGFVLTDESGSVLVLANPLPALRVDEDDNVLAIAEVRELERWQIDWVLDEVERRGGSRGRVDPAALAEAPFTPGAPYLELVNVRGEDST